MKFTFFNVLMHSIWLILLSFILSYGPVDACVPRGSWKWKRLRPMHTPNALARALTARVVS